MIDGSGVSHDMFVLRNPWSVANYIGDWNAEDENWTDDLVA